MDYQCILLRITSSRSTFTVVPQAYRTHVYETNVLSGNSAIFKCEIPSFVSDFVHVTGWLDETTGANFIPAIHSPLGTEALNLIPSFHNYPNWKLAFIP